MYTETVETSLFIYVKMLYRCFHTLGAYELHCCKVSYCHGAARGIQERGDEEYNKQGFTVAQTEETQEHR